ncbi:MULTISPECIES: DUF1329 domain-containing protein [Hydrocarboniphaga]|uniref:DUF1329 domain-containing protein n=1 Tax=Hydrocarboniphaga effusa AP103 TaxID=1172194 RepID=I8I4E0_9GAMM|nr:MULTISPECIES: DUF1329 domain-containing protein [Hydrocarboniphaga]EIT71061.1 hypothetical protein WQQ_11980 [Hydrocarboniphaga effusa AP103]MDZ4080003.1 DUF1329 domain-containing protein [Hydrocarboniphaga sp.]
MHIRKFDFDYSRRMFMGKTLAGAATAGVLAPMWSELAHSADVSKAYPDELLSIEMYTKGKIKPGDVLTADNVDAVKDLLDPVAYKQVKTMGRRINIVESTKDVTRLYPAAYLDSTLRNKGKAKFGADGNVYDEAGKPWVGGSPFPDAKDANEATANLTLSWGRHDYSQYAIRDWDIDPSGEISYQYDFVWCELNCTSRSDGKVWNNRSDLLRLQSVFFTAPNDTKGSSFLNTWYYDQRKFPDLIGYLPAFKRVRQFPTNQRFEPLVPGITLFLSDAWSAGDPMQTWGNYKIVGRGPMLGAIGNKNFTGGSNANYERSVHGGPKGKTFHETYMELIPECVIVEAEPTGFPRAPVGKKRTWIDVRNGMFIAYVTYDRRGEIWKSFEPQFAQYSNDKLTIKDANGKPEWSWVGVISHDIQANRLSRFVQAKEVTGGYKSTYSEAGVDVYNKFLTPQAIGRLGA